MGIDVYLLSLIRYSSLGTHCYLLIQSTALCTGLTVACRLSHSRLLDEIQSSLKRGVSKTSGATIPLSQHSPPYLTQNPSLRNEMYLTHKRKPEYTKDGNTHWVLYSSMPQLTGPVIHKMLPPKHASSSLPTHGSLSFFFCRASFYLSNFKRPDVSV